MLVVLCCCVSGWVEQWQAGRGEGAQANRGSLHQSLFTLSHSPLDFSDFLFLCVAAPVAAAAAAVLNFVCYCVCLFACSTTTTPINQSIHQSFHQSNRLHWEQRKWTCGPATRPSDTWRTLCRRSKKIPSRSAGFSQFFFIFLFFLLLSSIDFFSAVCSMLMLMLDNNNDC